MASYVGADSLNSTLLQYQGLLEKVLLVTVVTLPSVVFLFINIVMVYTLRSKPMFRETPRYVLLFNLLSADTINLVQSQTMYLLAWSQVRVSYPVCGFLIMVVELTSEVSPMTLVVMSLERYVAICFPLRHPNIATQRNISIAIICIWTLNFLNIMTQVLLLLKFPLEKLRTEQMPDFCSYFALDIGPGSIVYNRVFTCVLFGSAAVAIVASCVGVMLVAKAASTDKTSAQKAYRTILLHLFQLGLSLSGNLYSPLLMELAKTIPRIMFVRIHNVYYVSMVIFPRCLSSLIYGLRDQSIRPALLQNLCCGAKVFSQKTSTK